MFSVEQVKRVHAALSASPKRLDSQSFLYDDRGSALFDKICHESDYYIYRNEFSIVNDNAEKIAELIGPDAVLVDIGCGTGCKSMRILESMEKPAAFVALDIDPEVLVNIREKVKLKFPGLKVVTGVTDFTEEVKIDTDTPGRKIGFMAGNSIACYTTQVVGGVLKNCLESLGEDGVFLASFDSNQKPDSTVVQYLKGSYHELILNGLNVLNNYFGANFDLQNFKYDCIWNPTEKQVEFRLISKIAHTVVVDGRQYTFEKDEPFQIFSVKKWSLEDFKVIVECAGGVVKHDFVDSEGYIRLAWIEKSE